MLSVFAHGVRTLDYFFEEILRTDDLHPDGAIKCGQKERDRAEYGDKTHARFARRLMETAPYIRDVLKTRSRLCRGREMRLLELDKHVAASWALLPILFFFNVEVVFAPGAFIRRATEGPL